MLNAIALSLNLHMSKNLQTITVEDYCDALVPRGKINEIIRPYPIHAKSIEFKISSQISHKASQCQTNKLLMVTFFFFFLKLKNESSATLYSSGARVNQQHPPVQMKDG